MGLIKNAKLLACCLLLLPLFGTVPDAVPKIRAKRLTPLQEDLRQRLLVVLRQSTALFNNEEYEGAEAGFESVYTQASRGNLDKLAARALANMAGCRFARRQFKPALDFYLKSYQLARSAGDDSAVAALEGNIASLYSEMGELEPAAEWMSGVIERLKGSDRAEQLPKIMMQLAGVRASQGRLSESLDLYRRGVDAASSNGAEELAALGWNHMGDELLKAGRPGEAEPYLIEAYRIRKLHRYALESSYVDLGWLRLEQGDLESASALLDRALEIALRPGSPAPVWDVYQYRGQLRLAQGRLEDALSELRTARDLARAWRRTTAGGDSARTGGDVWADQVHSRLIEAGNLLCLKRGDPSLAEEAFEAKEESRAASLRLLIHSQPGSEAPPAYWKTVERLQNAEVQALRSPGKATTQAVGTLRAELIRMDAALDSGAQPRTGPILAELRASLPADAAFFSFHLGASRSWLWVVERGGLKLYPLPPAGVLAGRIEEFRQSVSAGGSEGRANSESLYRALFGQIDALAARKSRWILALDRELFEVPFAALRVGDGGGSAYLIERRSIEITPGAGVWLETRARRSNGASGGFLGVADPVYNTADSRFPGRARNKAPGALPLARLAGSGVEVRRAAQAWGGPGVLLTGEHASPEAVIRQLRSGAAIVHFATHVVESASRPSYGMIALSVNQDGEMQVLTPVEIAKLRTTAEMVTMSGCESASGAVLPGAGLLGLTRAWLAAGARSVLATYWRTQDDEGALFQSMYKLLRLGSEPADALRGAQVEMIQSEGWRSEPQYWAAYFIVGG